MQENQGQELLSELDRLTFVTSIVLLVLLFLLYFLVHSWIAIDEPLRGLALALIANLIPLLLIFIGSYLIYRKIQKIRSDYYTDELAYRISEKLTPIFSDELRRHEENSRAPDLLQQTEEMDHRSPEAVVPNSESFKRESIRNILRSVTLAMIYPHTTGSAHIRTFCHIADYKNKRLVPYCRWSPHRTQDAQISIPYDEEYSDLFIIARAFKKKRVVRVNLEPNHADNYPSDFRDQIHPGLKCVFAAPIFDPEPGGGTEVLGTISFDCTNLTLEEIGFDREEVVEIVYFFARGIYFLMKSWEE